MRNPAYTRQLIIEKAMPIFNTKGYFATSLSDITLATGITKGAIYGNFKNKDEVATVSFEYAAKIIMDELALRIHKAADAPAKLRSIVDYYSDYIQSPTIAGGCPILNSSIEAADNLPHLQARVIRSIALIKETFVKIINRGILESQIRKGIDVETFAISFYATIAGGICLSRIEGDMRAFSSIQKHLYQMVESISKS